MNLENKNDNIECSINDALPFFIKNKFSLFIYDIYLNLLYKYEPESKSHYALYLISRGNHLYEINNNIKTLSHTVKHNIEELEAIKSLKVSNTYNIFKNDENEYKIYLIDSIDDITRIIKEINRNKEKKKKLN